MVDTMTAAIASAWEADVRRFGATDVDVSAIAPAFGNPRFKDEVEVPVSPTVIRRRRAP